MATTQLITADDLFVCGTSAESCELVEGVRRPMVPTGGEHGEIVAELAFALQSFVRVRGLGRVYFSDTGFVLATDPDTVLTPDVAFVSASRVPPKAQRVGFLHLAPDLVVEVVSPSDRSSEVQAKVTRYLQAGVALVWVIEPRRHLVTIHTSNNPPVERGENDTLDGGEVLPGFQLAVRDLFV